MSVTYQGDCTWAECCPPSYSKDAWGFDTISRRYNGRSDQLETFIETFKHDKTLRDSTHRFCTFDKLTVSPGEIFSEVGATFRGVVGGGDLPAITVTGGRRMQSTSVEYTSTVLGATTGVTLEVEYWAPYKTVTWFSFGTLRTLNARDPSSISTAFLAGQQYDDMLRDLMITNTNGAKARLRIHRQRDYSRGQYVGFPTFGGLGNDGIFDMTTSSYNLYAQLVETEYRYEQVGSEIIMEQSTIELRLIDSTIGNIRPAINP